MTAVACPSCKKETEHHDGATAKCERCGCDLAVLVELKQTAARLQARALRQMRDHRYYEALRTCHSAWELCHDNETATIAIMSAILQRDLPEVAQWKRRSAISDGQSP